MSPTISIQRRAVAKQARQLLYALAFTPVLMGCPMSAWAQPGTRVVSYVSVCIDGSLPGTTGTCPSQTHDTKQIVLAPNGSPINHHGGMTTLADEHSTIFPPWTLSGQSDYLFFVASRTTANPISSGLVVLTNVSTPTAPSPNSSGQWTLDFAPEFGPNYQNNQLNPGRGQIFVSPFQHNLCPNVTDPTFQDQTFDLNYASPGTVVKDPTNSANNGPGGLVMIYEGTHRCIGLTGGNNVKPVKNSFYATIAVATSNDYGHTWPSYRYLLTANQTPQCPLPSQSPCTTPPYPCDNILQPCVGPNAQGGALGSSVCVGNVCAPGSSTPWPPDENYGRYPVLSPPESLQTAIMKGKTLKSAIGDQAPSAFVDDVNTATSPYLYITAGPLMVARAQLNGGTAQLSFDKWYQGSFLEAGVGGLETPISFLGPQGQAENCLAPGQKRTMGSFSYVEDTQQYMLTFVCISPNGDPSTQTGGPGAAWFYSTNNDLSHADQWSTPREFVGSWSAFRPTKPCSDYDGWYPSFMSLNTSPGHLSTNGYVFYMDGCTGGFTPLGGRRFSTRAFTINWKSTQTFQPLDVQHIYVLGSDGTLWLEHGPFGTLPPPRHEIDASVSTFQALQDDTGNVLVLGMDGDLWLESPPFGNVPPERIQVDANVRAFQGLNSTLIYVLANDGNLWQEQAPFGSVPPQRQQVDGNVRAFQAVNNQTILVLGTDGRLWYEYAPYGTVPPARQQIDANVLAFQIINPGGNVWVLGTDGSLWLEQPPFGNVPPVRTQIDGNVRAFQAFDYNDIYVLGTDGNLWLEQGPFGTVPPLRTQVDANVRSFQYVDLQHVFVLGLDGNLWLEPAPFGTVPPPNRKLVDGNVM